MPEKNPCFDCGRTEPMLFSTPDHRRGNGTMSVAVCVPCFNERNPDNKIKE